MSQIEIIVENGAKCSKHPSKNSKITPLKTEANPKI